MKKFKLLSEFKTFITRGNVIDLAVGMIIGAAFTAIVTALVNGIFKPLIDAIPMGDMSGLITMLVPKNSDGIVVAAGDASIDLSKSVYINWGDFIMAVVNFLITAVVLFAIIKVINTVRGDIGEYRSIKIDKALKAELKAQGMNRKQMQEYVKQQQKEEADRLAAEEAAKAPESTDKILNDIRELLKLLNPEAAAALAKKAAEDKAEEQA